MNNILLQSNKSDYGTPDWLFNMLNKEFHFDADVCADENNHKCKNYSTKEINCLRHSWGYGTYFMNPPYQKKQKGQPGIGDFIKKAYEESLKGCVVVCLIPARTDTIWWFDYCIKAKEIRFLKGRLKFIGGASSATFPSAIVIFKKWNEINPFITPIIRWVDYRNKK